MASVKVFDASLQEEGEGTYSSPAELFIINLVRFGCALKVGTEHVDDVPLLFLTEKLGFTGCVWQEEKCCDRNYDSDRSFNEEDPWPPVVAAKSDFS